MKHFLKNVFIVVEIHPMVEDFCDKDTTINFIRRIEIVWKK